MDITKAVYEIISELQEDITEKQEEIAIIKTTDFTKSMDLKTWDKLCETTIFNELGNNNIATKVVKQIFPEAKNICNDPNDVRFEINGFTCFLSKLGNGLKADVTWYEKIKPRTFYKTIKKVTDRDSLNSIEKQVKDAYERYLKQCEGKNKELNDKLIKFRLEVIPILERFAKAKYIDTDMRYRRSIFQTFPTIEELLKET